MFGIADRCDLCFFGCIDTIQFISFELMCILCDINCIFWVR